MGLSDKLNRFSSGSCCGTAVIKVVSLTPTYCVVSRDCSGDCEPSGIPVDCINFADLEVDDTFTVWCRKLCGYAAPGYFDPCDSGGGGGGGGNDPHCDDGYTGCTAPHCHWTWTNIFGGQWIGTSCPSEPDFGDCQCQFRPTDPGEFFGQTKEGICCRSISGGPGGP